MSARPAVVSDILSFETRPDREEDFMLCTVKWQQDSKDRSEQYMVFKARNVTAGDTQPVVPVFIQKSYYEKRFSDTKDIEEFMITEKDWMYGQRDETGADRFVVLHDKANQPYQHRFVASWLLKLINVGHDVACAGGYAYYADKIDSLGKAYLGDSLHPYTPPVVKSGDVLLVPSKLPFFSFGNPKTIEWQQKLSGRSAEYYCFKVVNTTQKGQDVMFYIQREWWDKLGDKDSTSEHHISKIATKNAKGLYELKIDNKCQYGQIDQTGKGRWVVYHDKERKPYQHRFIKSTLHSKVATAAQVQAYAADFGFNVGVNVSEVLETLESIVGNYLHTFN